MIKIMFGEKRKRKNSRISSDSPTVAKCAKI